MEDRVKFLTWNVQGLNDRRKIRKVSAYLVRRKIDVALLQESHLPAAHIECTRSLFRGPIHAAGFTAYAQGVVTWVSPRSHLTLEEVHTDVNGRYTITRCKGRGLEFIIFNIYGPNFDCPQFIHDLQLSARQFKDVPIIWGGDFNCTLDPALDRSGGPPRRLSSMAEAIKDTLIELGLLDAWRMWNPAHGGYTHYSAPHQLHARIDYWFISDTFRLAIRDCEVLARTYSDHSPVALTLAAPVKCPPPFTWRFPPYALLDEVFKTEMLEAINTFFETNIGSVEHFATIWETFKVYIRGIAISKHSGVLRSIRNRLAQLVQTLHTLEAEFLANNTSQTAESFKTTLEEYHTEADREVKLLGKYAVARTYGEGERPGAVLASLMRGQRHTTLPIILEDEAGKRIEEPDKVADQFKTYYTDVYTTKSCFPPADMPEYLEHIKLPWLLDEHRAYLMQPLEAWEVQDSLMTMRSGSAPGHDGLTVGFYKEFKDLLIPHLISLFEEMTKQGYMPPSMREALLIVILKPDKPPQACFSYRPCPY